MMVSGWQGRLHHACHIDHALFGSVPSKAIRCHTISVESINKYQQKDAR
jgi:hypothetical protein